MLQGAILQGAILLDLLDIWISYLRLLPLGYRLSEDYVIDYKDHNGLRNR